MRALAGPSCVGGPGARARRFAGANLWVAAWVACLVGGEALPLQPASADIRIVKTNGQPVPVGSATLAHNDATGGWEIALLSLYAPGAETVYEIRADGGERIDAINILVDGPAAGSPVIVRAVGEAPGYLHSVMRIMQQGSAETIIHKVQTTHDIGMVQAHSIGDCLAGRDLIGPIIATTPSNALRGITNAKAGRHILGDVTADNGRIVLVQALGDIGQPHSPVTIRARHNVYHVEGAAVHANIHSRHNGGTGGVFALIAEEFEGTLLAEKLILNPWMGMEGLIYITQRFEGQIVIGKSFNVAGQYVQVPANGLRGQIIINADNAGGTWTSPVRIGFAGDPQQIVLNGPNYPHVPEVLGGGSVGLAPFALHDEACVPANGAVITKAACDPPVTVSLRHYGPVLRNAPLPVTIQRRPAGTQQAFAAVPEGDFAVAEATNANVLTITAAPDRSGFVPGFEYRIMPSAGLRCDVPSQPPVAWTDPYHITVQAPVCAGNVNGDAVVNVNDLLLVIAFWGQAAAQFPAADLNGDGVISVNDLLLVLNNWGPCA